MLLTPDDIFLRKPGPVSSGLKTFRRGAVQHARPMLKCPRMGKVNSYFFLYRLQRSPQHGWSLLFSSSGAAQADVSTSPNSQVSIKQHLNMMFGLFSPLSPPAWISILATAASTVSNSFWFCAKKRIALKWFAHYSLGPPDFDSFNSGLLAELIPRVWRGFYNVCTSCSAGRNMGKTACPTSKALLRTLACVMLHFRILTSCRNIISGLWVQNTWFSLFHQELLIARALSKKLRIEYWPQLGLSWAKRLLSGMQTSLSTVRAHHTITPSGVSEQQLEILHSAPYCWHTVQV